MNLVDQLQLHAQALRTAVDSDPKFFAGVIHYVRQLDDLLSGGLKQPSKEELSVLAGKIEEFFRRWRPSGDSLYIPPRQAADSDDTVQDIFVLVSQLYQLRDGDFLQQFPQRTASPDGASKSADPKPRCAFIGHGRSRLWARVKTYLEDEFNLPAVTYETKSRTGESIVPVLEDLLDPSNVRNPNSDC